tara:strand:+ start:206 stop:889 length:684 start_codon:yes stop_codon:yes gene_type:complete
MGYRWTKTQIEPKTIVESRQVDLAFSNYTSVVNGGMDRDNLPKDSVEDTGVVNQAMGTAQLGTENFHIPFAAATTDGNYGNGTITDENTRGNKIRGYVYQKDPINEGDTFLEIESQTIECQEGMLHSTFKINTYMPMYWSYYKNFSTTLVTRKRVQFQILVNGVIVYMAAALGQTFYTTNISAMIPVSKGTNTVSVRMRVPGRISEDNDQVILTYWGGQLYLHNYYR